MSYKVPLPVLAPDPRPLVPCTECGKCCTYVAVGINAPTSPRLATDILWYLYHDRVYVYRDGAGEWSVHFETRCRQLGDDLLCRVYAERPHICRAFDNETCEVNCPEGRVLTFTAPEAFLSWLEVAKPRVYRAVLKRYVPERLKAAKPVANAAEAAR
jgi:Fe-S-cluster containining protein